MASSQNTNTTNAPSRCRRRWVFSLRSLLIALVAVCILLGLYARRAPFRHFVKKADEYGCNLHYNTFLLGPPLDSLVFELDDLMGTGTLNTPCDLGFFEEIGGPIRTYSDAEFGWLFTIHTLEEFRADGIYLNDELATKLVKAHPDLRELNSQNARLTASGAAAIALHKSLRRIRLTGDESLNDDVVSEFEKMSQLEYISVDSPAIDSNTLVRLKKSLPNCTVHGPWQKN